MITTLVAIAVFIAFALKEAHEDRKGKPVDAHAPDWVDRAVFAFVVAIGCDYANIYTTDATVWGFLWKLVGFCLIGYGAFTPVFRWRLNRLRGMDARYVSPSSLYDWFFIWCAMPAPKEGGKMWHLFSHDTIGGARMKHAELYSSNLDFWTRIHRAGRLAYITEGLALLIGCGITLAH